MKLPISKLRYPLHSNPPGDDTFVVVDKYVDNTWKSYKARLSSIKNFVSRKTGDTWTITLDPNGGTVQIGSDQPSTKPVITQFRCNEMVGSQLPTPTAATPGPGCAGVTFQGWWTAPLGGGFQVTSATQVPSYAGEITLYARWQGVIHYTNVGEVSIVNGVADGFSHAKALQTVEYFDFSKNFQVVMKCGRGPTHHADHPIPSREDVFAGFPAPGQSNDNIFMDFGVIGNEWAAPQWEIAKGNGYLPSGKQGAIFYLNDVFWLGVNVDRSSDKPI